MSWQLPFRTTIQPDQAPLGMAFWAREAAARYPGATRLALDQVSLAVPRGRLVALVGHNGAGKSSLLKAILGLLPLSSGSIDVLDGAAGDTRTGRVAYLPQSSDIDWRFPVSLKRLVLSGTYADLGWLRRPGAAEQRATSDAMQRMMITDLADRQISQLSGGQQQRALLARALVQRADLVLLDEPFNAVDDASQNMIVDTLHSLRSLGATIVIATHGFDHTNLDADMVVEMCDGRILEPRVTEVPAPFLLA